MSFLRWIPLRVKRVLAVKLRSTSDNFIWAATNAYGLNVDYEKGIFLAQPGGVLSQWSVPWCIGGDFNLIRFPYEKKGGRICS